MFRTLPVIASAAAIFAFAGSVSAAPMTFDLSDGDRSAVAEFAFSDAGRGNAALTITVRNTSPAGSARGQWLTGLFFDIAGDPNVIRIMGGAPDGAGDGSASRRQFDSPREGFRGVWAFHNDLPSGDLPFGGQRYGLMTIDDGVFPQDSAAQAGGGLTDWNISDPAKVSEAAPIPNRDSIGVRAGELMTFDFFLSDFDSSQAAVSNVAVRFGSGFNEYVTLIPLPAPAAMGLLGLIGVAVARRRMGRLMRR